MEKKLITIDFDNIVFVVRSNGDTVIVTEDTAIDLSNAVMEQLVRNSGAYKSFVATKDDVINALECDNTKLQNEIVGLKEELEHVKAAKDRLQLELTDVADKAQPIVKGHVVNQEGAHLYDVDGNFLVDCGIERRAIQVQKMLYAGKVSLDIVIEMFGNTGGKKRRAASKVELDDFNWDDVPVKGQD